MLNYPEWNLSKTFRFNGFIAYTKLDVGKNLQIWLMDSSETNGSWRRLLKIKRSRRKPINADSPMSLFNSYNSFCLRFMYPL